MAAPEFTLARMSVPHTDEEIAITEPMDRSVHPQEMTSVMPMAANISAAVCESRFQRVKILRKFGEKIAL